MHRAARGIGRLGVTGLLAVGGCAHRAATPDDEVTAGNRDASEAAIQCARSTAQAAGFVVRMRDPRNPWVLIAESTTSTPPDRIVVRLIPGSSPEMPALVSASAEGPRAGSVGGTETREAARRIEAKCGAPR